ncbi:hypothetical protein [Actinomycetospora atypica]|uniref:Uncharacterized protein n=1 Tax=Actinomycetospora atypica TaxID=1290095 RepID=A0ABV9YQE3_9PSEU
MTLAPDLAEPVAGWRIWNVLDGERGPQLVSPVRPLPWAHRSPTSATCRSGCTPCPSSECRCGLYASAGLGLLPNAQDGVGTVLGCVGLWGHVVEHSVGWRGEHGYPLVLFVLSAGRFHDVAPLRRLLRHRSGSMFGGATDEEDAETVRALSRDLARLYAVPVHPAQDLFEAAVLGRSWSAQPAADGVLAEAVTGLAGRREGDPEALARLDRRVQDLIGSAET